MKLLLHTCCGPCTIHPLEILHGEGMEIMGYFHRSNIHPYSECRKREETLLAFAETQGLAVIVQKEYDLEGFLRSMAFRESRRCGVCYHTRLTATALVAKKGRFDAFSSTLLYSRFQNHDLIRETGEAVAAETGVPFLYRDFRTGWKQGIEASKALGMYRQQYCGCIYSEKERFCPRG
jgi:predicted adenine nucleotide alpha hydrolase (AANH) superfamily ATPase